MSTNIVASFGSANVTSRAQDADVSVRFLNLFKVLIAAFVTLMALGAGVRAMHAGVSCPDWPLCFGKMIPDYHPTVYFEFVHRAYAGILSLCYFVAFIYLVRRPVATKIKVLAFVALLTLMVQIRMGGLTVLQIIPVSTVVSHLLLATILVSSMTLIFNILNSKSVKIGAAPARKTLRWLVIPFPVAVFFQIALGGMVAASYAGSVCVDFPKCNGQWIPTLSGPIGLQVMHRFGAYAVALYGLTIFTYLITQKQKPFMTKQLSGLGYILFSLVLIQICVGVANLVFFIPAWLTVLHQFVAIMILLTGIRVAYVAHFLTLKKTAA